MPTFSFTTSALVENELSTPSKVNSRFEEIAYWLNSLKLDGDNIADSAIEGRHLDSSVVDDETLEFDSVEKVIKVKQGSIDRNMLTSLGQQESEVSTTFTTTSETFVDVTDGEDEISVTLTTTGRPVVIMLNQGSIECSRAGNSAQGSVQLLRGETVVGTPIRIGVDLNKEGTNAEAIFAASTFMWVDLPSNGTYTYKLQIKSRLTGTTVTARTVKIVAWEIF